MFTNIWKEKIRKAVLPLKGQGDTRGDPHMLESVDVFLNHFPLVLPAEDVMQLNPIKR